MPPKKKKSTASTDVSVAMATDVEATAASPNWADDAALATLLSGAPDWAEHERAGVLESHLWPRVVAAPNDVSPPLAQCVVALLAVKALTHASPEAVFCKREKKIKKNPKNQCFL